jgi:branched-chain amino acid transport system substrate-binding protein
VDKAGKAGASPSTTESTSSAAAAPTQAAPRTTAGASCQGPKSTINLGSVGALSGIVGAFTVGGVQAVKSAVSAINATGGLDCHPLKYHVADDGSDPARNAAATQKMVEEDHVIAFLWSGNPIASGGSIGYLEKHRVPMIGGTGGETFTSPIFYPVAASGRNLIVANYGMFSTTLTPEQKQHVAVLTCVEATICSSFGTSDALAIARDAGLGVVYSGVASLAQPDYTANCQSAKNAGAQAFFIVGDGGMLTRTVRSCALVTFNPQFGSSPVAIAPSLVQDSRLQGLILGGTTLPWMVPSNAQAAAYVATLTKYTPGASPSGAGSVGWASWLVFQYALRKGVPDNPTSADVVSGLNQIKNNTFGGFTAPLTFAPNQDQPSPACWWTIAIKDKQFVSPDGGKRHCK